MKYIQLNALFLVFVFHSSCGQNQTNPPQDNFSKEHNGISESQLKEMATSRVPMGQVRNIKQDRNGNILIAATWGGVFRYDQFFRQSFQECGLIFGQSRDGDTTCMSLFFRRSSMIPGALLTHFLKTMCPQGNNAESKCGIMPTL